MSDDGFVSHPRARGWELLYRLHPRGIWQLWGRAMWIESAFCHRDGEEPEGHFVSWESTWCEPEAG